jgi:type 1 glutamine amidotransferase
VTRPQALVVSGGGRHGDPWHPFPATSAALATALQERGVDATVQDDADAALAALEPGALPDLLVLNIGWYGTERFTAAAADAWVAALRAGLPTLVAHSSLTAFPDWALWRDVVGGGWVYNTTYHPDYADGVALARPGHPLVAGLDRLAISDERYTRLHVDPASAVFLEHEEEGERHALGWTRTWGASRLVADALGHDADSYGAAGRRTLLDRELAWLLAPATS